MKVSCKITALSCIGMLALAVAGCADDADVDGSGAAMETSCYPVARVVDGDTFRIDVGGGREDVVRMLGIDTPETVKPNAPVEPYGKEASAYAKRLLDGRTACLELDVEARDKYDRLLAYVYLEDGTFVNETMIAGGYAQVLTIPPNVRHAERFLALQREARDAGRGLWGLGAPGEGSEPSDEEASRDGGEPSDEAASEDGGEPSDEATSEDGGEPSDDETSRDGGEPSDEARTGDGGADGRAMPGAAADRDCGSFSSREEAQSFFEAEGGPARDPHRLDGDRDGLACETLP